MYVCGRRQLINHTFFTGRFKLFYWHVLFFCWDKKLFECRVQKRNRRKCYTISTAPAQFQSTQIQNNFYVEFKCNIKSFHLVMLGLGIIKSFHFSSFFLSPKCFYMYIQKRKQFLTVLKFNMYVMVLDLTDVSLKQGGVVSLSNADLCVCFRRVPKF